MKKFYSLLIVIGVALVLSACKLPNNDYYKVANQTVTVYANTPIQIDPYQIFADNQGLLNVSGKTAAQLKDEYPVVSVEYRITGNGDYSTFPLNNNDVIYAAKPTDTSSILQVNHSYDFKIHFNTTGGTESNRINFIVTYNFVKSLSVAQNTVNLTAGTGATYNLLSNVVALNANGTKMTAAEISAAYTAAYSVKMNNSAVTVTDGTISIQTPGTYNVTISLTAVSTSTDGTSGATGSNSTPTATDLSYTIVVAANNGTNTTATTATTQPDSSTGASTGA